jgi:hypothetical protein
MKIGIVRGQGGYQKVEDQVGSFIDKKIGDPLSKGVDYSYDKLKEMGKGLYEKYGPEAGKYYDKMLSYVKKKTEVPEVPKNIKEEYLPPEDNPDARDTYDRVLNSARVYKNFVNSSNKLLGQLFTLQSGLKDEFVRLDKTIGKINPYVKGRNRTLYLNEDSSAYLEEMNESYGKIKTFMKEIRNLVESNNDNFQEFRLEGMEEEGEEVKFKNF